MWTVDDEQFEVFRALLTLSVHTHQRILAGERSEIRQSEETITETTLLDLSLWLPHLRISTHTHKKESGSGADWEWWIEGSTEWFGMLVQAKKLHAIKGQPNGGYGFGYAPKSATGDLQVDRLIQTAKARAKRLAAVYVLYNGTDEPTSEVRCPFHVVGRHPHAGGITAMSAHTVRALAEKNTTRSGRYRDVPLEQARPHAIPWSCLATCGINCASDYDPDIPQSWADAQFGEYDPAKSAAAAINALIAQFPHSYENLNDAPTEALLHGRPPLYVPRTADRWNDDEAPRSPHAHHLGVLYRNRPITDS